VRKIFYPHFIDGRTEALRQVHEPVSHIKTMAKLKFEPMSASKLILFQPFIQQMLIEDIL
jgi:hypothetical protein